jgi:hypothetical protein
MRCTNCENYQLRESAWEANQNLAFGEIQIYRTSPVRTWHSGRCTYIIKKIVHPFIRPSLLWEFVLRLWKPTLALIRVDYQCHLS